MDNFKSRTRETTYNFRSEREVFTVLGGYTIMREPLPHFIINILYILCISLLYIYSEILAIATMVISSSEKVTTVLAFKALCMFVVSSSVTTINLIFHRSLNSASKMLDEGIFHYEDKVLHEEHYNIKKINLERVRFFIDLITKLLCVNFASNAFMGPLVQFFTVNEDVSNRFLNPYLPLPLYVPFSTRTFLGFGVAFLSNAVLLFFMNISYICHEEIYISTALQLSGELDVLSHSLQNIYKRAFFKFSNRTSVTSKITKQRLCESPEFKRCLSACLRENIQHHHIILRFVATIKPYIETTTAVASFSISLLMACAILLVVENPEKNAGLIMMLLAEIAGFLQMCWVGQLITDKGNKMKDAMYATPWSSCDKNYKAMLNIMITNMQRPMVLRARGFNIEVSLQTFGNMVTLAYKTANVLREIVD